MTDHLPDGILAVDWGTTSLRAYDLDGGGRILRRRAAPAGILAVEAGAFEETLLGLVADWRAEARKPIVMSGMIGSRQGWAEAPYVGCPTDAAAIAGAAIAVPLADGGRAWIAPGLSTRDAVGVPDVMRGEETQILGILGMLPDGPQTLCLPGTHSKWATVEDGRITGFSTHMTGEVFDVLRRHSILGRMIEHTAWDDAAFEQGLAAADRPGGLLHHLFGVRTRGLVDGMAATAAGAFLSGLLIGHEVAAALAGGRPARVHLLGAEGLTTLYERALGRHGVAAATLDKDAVAAGLFAVARSRPEIAR